MKGRVLLWIAAIGTLLFVAFYAGLGIYARSRPLTKNVGSGSPEGISLTISPFELVDSRGGRFGQEQLRGRVWIADCIFTRCPGPCARMTKQVAHLQSVLPAEIGFISVTVDPQYDLPAVMEIYAAKAGADPARWKFLTGPRDDVYDFIHNGLRLAAQERDPGEPVTDDGPIIHSSKFILIDANGNVVGFYEGLEAEDQTRLERDARKLAGV
jgi:protein SCO1/2